MNRQQNAPRPHAAPFDTDDSRDDARFSLRRKNNVPPDDDDELISNGYGGVCPRDPRATIAEFWVWGVGDAR